MTLQYTQSGEAVPVIEAWANPAPALIDELDTLISDLESAMLARDQARATLAERERTVTITEQRILLVRHSLALLSGQP